MAVFLASDMHLRIDHPERSRRFARWVDGLDSIDSLYLVGDVCDFWFAARQQRGDPFRCEGLRSLADFKKRGGALTIIAGNHDYWLGPLYRDKLGATFLTGPVDLEISGLKFHLVHGHKVGGRPAWKSFMESQAFLKAFTALPAIVADRLDSTLNANNEVKRASDEGRLLPYYQAYADRLTTGADIVVFGHIHTPLNDMDRRPRLIVLGSWHESACYMKVENGEATLIREHDPTAPLVGKAS